MAPGAFTMSLGAAGAWWFNVGFTPSVGAKRYEVWMTTGSQNVGTTTPYTFTDSAAHTVGAGKNYSVSVRAYDALSGGTYTQASNAFMSVQLAPLETPKSFAAGTPTVTSIPLSWVKANDNTRNTYTLKEGSTTVYSGPGFSATATGLPPGSAHTFTVVTVDASGSVSAPATLGPVTTLTYSIPGTPSVSATGYYSVSASWAPCPEPGIIGYEVYLVYGDYSAVTSTTSGSASASFSGLAPGTTYGVRVRGYDAAGNRTGFSGYGWTVTPTPPPPAPTWTHSPGADLL
jgi:hypothetical protein